jgi:Site-specific DNA methylase
MLKNKDLTYVSLFSSAGVGCYGFKEEGFHCVATNELLSRRLDVQRYNRKCELDTGYISGDITLPSTKNLIFSEIGKWKRKGNDRVDVVVATPPCQGISVVNHKKNNKDIKRNSLVIESVELVKEVHPRFFVFENVMGFAKTFCIDKQGRAWKIGDYIQNDLGGDYIITFRILNFMNYGSNSSRTRTLVLGVDKSLSNEIVPWDLFPGFQKEPTLRDVIANMPPLDWGEICANDFYHAFRLYDPSMRSWIHDLKEGESAFGNKDPERRPHHYRNGKFIENVNKNRDKYTRAKWDRFIQCVTTRNDQLAAQNTIHPIEDRVFSIRELMKMMSIPPTFNWLPCSLEELNSLPLDQKQKLYSKNESNIRQCLGEAVPTEIMRQIASSIKKVLNSKTSSNDTDSSSYLFKTSDELINFIRNNPDHLSVASLARIVELNNSNRSSCGAFYTNKFLVNQIVNELPPMVKDTLNILEPSVGAGGFIPLVAKRFDSAKRINIDAIDLDPTAIKCLEILLPRMGLPKKIHVNLICHDFLTLPLTKRYDLIIGNPPFATPLDKNFRKSAYFKTNINKDTNDLSEFFLEKALLNGSYVSLVLNKTFLNTAEFTVTRDLLRTKPLEKIIDFGRYGFGGVSIETICLMMKSNGRPTKTAILSLRENKWFIQKQSYITDPRFPRFLIYRNAFFDGVADHMTFDVFDVFRDRQITKKNTQKRPSKKRVWVLKAKNLSESGLTPLANYDRYIDVDIAKKLSCFKYLNNDSVFITQNMTYNPRVFRKPKGVLCDGSVAILLPHAGVNFSNQQLAFFSSDTFKQFYFLFHNLSTQSINVDKTSVFFYGVRDYD